MIPIVWTKAALLVAVILLIILAMFSGRTAALGAPAIVIIYAGIVLLLKVSGSENGAKSTGLIVVAGAALLYLLPLWAVNSFEDRACTVGDCKRKHFEYIPIGYCCYSSASIP